jgi:hypothetical protein
MKATLSLLTLCSALAVAQADVVKFNLGPNGLNPTNVVPAVTNSTGSGDVISGGITLQTTNATLSFAIGYGAAAGFTNLTGPATAASINGPAVAGSNAPMVVDLSYFAFPAVDQTNGGVIFGSVALNSEQKSNLLAGLDYIVIATESNPAGEVRGQLMPVMTGGPTLVCPGDTNVECTGKPITLTAQVASASGTPLTVTWMVNGVTIQTNLVSTSGTTNLVAVGLTMVFELGTNTVGVTVTDGAGNAAACDSVVVVQDTIPPVITKATLFPTTLWPPNGAMVPISIAVVVKEACCLENWRIVSVTSNEAGRPGNSSPQWIITGKHGLSLSAERDGHGSGRVYTVTIEAQDCAGNLSAPVTLTVTVPHDQGKNNGPGK